MNILSLLTMLNLVLVLTHAGADLQQTIKLPPLLLCDGPTEPTSKIVPMCFDLCKFDWKIDSPIAIEMFNQVLNEKVELIQCYAYEDVRKESESFLFSKEESVISSVRVNPDLSKCQALMSKYCGSSPCKYVESLPDPDYEWGKEKFSSYERYFLQSHTEAVVLMEGIEEYIMLGSKKVKGVLAYFHDNDNLVVYMWKPINRQITTCPLESDKTVLAYSHSSDSSYRWVPDVGITLNMTTDYFSDVRCSIADERGNNKIYLTKQGILVRDLKNLPTKQDSKKVIVLSGNPSASEKLILNSMNTLEMIKSREYCLSQCYLIPLPGVHLLGIQGIYTSEAKSSTLCSRFVSPVLKPPVSICNEPELMVHVQMAHAMLWWDPTKPHLNTSSTCTKHMTRLPKRPITHGCLTVDSRGIHLEKSAVLSQLHPNAFSQTSIADYIKDNTVVSLDYNYVPGSITKQETKPKSTISEDYDNWVSDIGDKLGDVLKSAWDWVGSISDEIRVTLIIIVSLIVAVVFVSICSYWQPKRSRPLPRYLPPQEDIPLPQVRYSRVRRV